MMKVIAAALLTGVALTGCGGGGSGSQSTAPVANTVKLSFYGNPMVSAQGAVVHDAVASAPTAASTTSDANTATVTDLTTALAAQGVTANVSVQVMDGTTLHQLIMGSNNGLPPTPDQFKTDPSEWIIANFALDDMATPATDATQSAAIAQFQQDLTVFIQRARTSGKVTFIVQPIPTCDQPNGYSAAYGLALAETNAANAAGGYLTGGLPATYVVQNGVSVDTFTQGHMGADCRTPDTYLQNARTQSVAADIANRVKLLASSPAAASDASGTVAASSVAAN